MFSPHPLTTPGRANPFANAYRQIDAETAVTDASPHRLIGMLFDAYMAALAQARGAMRQRDIAAKCQAITRAARIVEEGLRAGLDLNAGGELATSLDELYAYVATRLTLANLHNDESMLDECQRLMAPLRDAWGEIGARAPQAQ
jgi:flagellar protein FliS